MSMTTETRTTIEPNNFDWVSAHAACSVSKVFHQLQLEIRTDIETRNRLSTENEKSKYFYTCASNGNSLSVFIESQSVEVEGIGVRFTRTPKGIDAYSLAERLLFSGTVTLSNDGQCRIKVGEIEYNFWQFRKLTLEDVFFTNVARWRP